jgi:hypothetical protein
MKIKNFVEGAAIAGLNFIKKKEEPYTEDLWNTTIIYWKCL